MSSRNGDKSRFHRDRKSKIARRERTLALRKKVVVDVPVPPKATLE
jgi:hypothetical protein